MKLTNKHNRTTPITPFWYIKCKLSTYFTHFSSVFIVDFDQVNICCDWAFFFRRKAQDWWLYFIIFNKLKTKSKFYFLNFLYSSLWMQSFLFKWKQSLSTEIRQLLVKLLQQSCKNLFAFKEYPSSKCHCFTIPSRPSTQPAITSSKLTIETLEQGVK